MIENNNSKGSRLQVGELSTEDRRKSYEPGEVGRGNRMSDKPNLKDSQVELSGGAPTWWIVFVKEINELWMGGKAPLLLLIFCILQGALTYFMVSNTSDPTPPKEMVYFTLENAIAVGLLIGLIIGADGISGERERLTFESLLLTPASRRQIIVGKFLAAISPWPAALAITIPFLAVLSQGDEILGPAVLWGTLMGSLMAPAFTAMGMVVSFWSNSNRTSLFVSLVMYLVFFIPTQLPSGGQAGKFGRLLKSVNPMESNGHFLEKILVNNRGLAEFWPWLKSPVLFAVIVYVLLFWYASSRLRFEGGKTGKFWSYWGRRIGLSVIAGLMIPLNTFPVVACQDAAGDWVDPADRSSQRTQYLESFAAGQFTNLSCDNTLRRIEPYVGK